MLHSIYTPLSGALAQERVLEVIANNLANLNTTAFKGEKVGFTLLKPEPNKHYQNPLPPANYKVNFDDVMPLVGNEVDYVGVAGVARDFRQGPAVMTGNPHDLMLEGEGFLKIETTEGSRFTRDGSLHINPDGYLVTANGASIQGEKGSIQITDTNFKVNTQGEVYEGTRLVDKLLIYKFDSSDELERVGKNEFFHNGPVENAKVARGTQVKQGALEGSNVNAIESMTSMIMAHRSFEAYQRAIKNYDSMLDRSANSIGEVRA